MKGDDARLLTTDDEEGFAFAWFWGVNPPNASTVSPVIINIIAVIMTMMLGRLVIETIFEPLEFGVIEAVLYTRWCVYIILLLNNYDIY